MNQYKICVYAICKNEEQFVDRWMDAVKEADLVVVLDTGSTDRTVEKLRERGAVVYEKQIVPWRFDDARNCALSYVPEDVDVCVSNDIDEIFEPGWRKKLEAAWRPVHTRARYWFVWSHNPDGTTQKEFPMGKIHRRHGFRWVHPAHEVLEYSGAQPDKIVWVRGLVLHHYPDLTKPNMQSLSLLELSVQENPQDDRSVFWLGHAYLCHNQYALGIQTLQKYLSLPTARWNEERSASMRFIARCYEAQGDRKMAIAWLYRAVEECPMVREPYLALAKAGYQENNWPLVYSMVQRGLSVTQKSGSYLTEPESWGPALYYYGAVSAYYLGQYGEARNYAARACELHTADKTLKSSLVRMKQLISGQAYKKGGLEVG